MSTSVMAYYGSKNSIAEEIVALMPEHRGYIEPFAGSLSVLLAKQPSPFECVNDIDGHLMTFWRVLRDHAEDLERVCALTPHSRAEYATCWPIPEGLEDLERARRVWVKLSQGRGGQMRPTGWRYHEITRGRGSGMPTTLNGYVGRFAAAATRLKNVSLEQIDALELIRRYGRDSETLIYADPPYLGATRTRTGYAHEMNKVDEHEALAEVLHQADASVLLSGYASDLYESLYADWDRHEISAYTGQGVAGGNVGGGQRTEVLWCNRPIYGGRIDFNANHTGAAS